jgi:eukaryotic-like serine/threonine-protein kinase
MAIGPGSRLGPYEVTALIGEGGMGKVWRAHHIALNRDDALKVLPEAFVSDPDRLARFRREAQVLASLNHSNIAHVYGLEQADGAQALVMELVEGPTFADRIARGPIPLDEALPIAKQIAEALEAAHEQGIIHRDLKPANIKLRPDGTVKVLDFGLAKALEPPGGREPITDHASLSPTITSPAMMTGVGVLLGTAAYMSPEQAKGKPADRRSDVWAFGAVLFEMLTGKRAFDGTDVGDTLAAVLRAEPDWSALPAETAFPVRTLLRGCLEKDPRQRIGSLSAALFVLRHQMADASINAPAGYQVRRDVRRIAVLTTTALIVGAVVAGTGVQRLTRSVPPLVVRTTITASDATALIISDIDRDIAITPDGSRVIYRGDNQLLVRALDQLQPTILSGLGAPHGVFISPDGQWVGFFDGATNAAIKKVSITGGRAETVCATGEGSPGGATWGPDGTVIFATFAAARGLQRVAAAGGEPTAITKVDRARGESDHLWPEFLPGGKAVLFTITAGLGPAEAGQIAVLDLETGRSKILIRGGSHAHYVPTGHLVYGVSGALRAVAFDLKRLEVIGTPAPVLEGVVTKAIGAADMAVAANGSLVYVAGGVIGGGLQTVVSVDRQGRPLPLPGLPPDRYRTVRVSPDGTKLALATFDEVSIYDLARATVTPLTTGPTHDSNPLWTPDGQRIVFRSAREGYPELFVGRVDGSGDVERLFGRARNLVDLLPDSWSKDGTQLLFTEVLPNIQCAIGQVALERPSDVTMLVKNDFCNAFAALSPDGRWIAYSRLRGTVWEVYVERYPELGNRQLISAGGGDIPVWSRDGRELFFKSPDGRQMFAALIQSGTTLVAGRPQMLFEFAMLPSGLGFRAYDIAPDGRFLIIRSAKPEASTATAPQIIVVQNWDQELKRLVPAR